MPDDFIKDEQSGLSPIVIADRGNCTFVTKVRNIEKLGVKLAIICDSKSEYTQNVIMGDDGSGNSVNIPSFILGKKDCENIKDTIKMTNSSVYVRTEIDIVHPDNRVEYEYWFSSVLDQDPWVLYDLSLYQKALDSNALFTPRVLTYSCKYCSDEFKSKNCLVNGEYCPFY
jgi:hypothetical protein